jgi:hypothetical protein
MTGDKKIKWKMLPGRMVDFWFSESFETIHCLRYRRDPGMEYRWKFMTNLELIHISELENRSPETVTDEELNLLTLKYSGI